MSEIRALLSLVRQSVRESLAPVRLVIAVDSRVTLGAVAKGRSSSRQVNGLLRALTGWLVLGRVRLYLLWVPSEANPSDYPSRFLPLPRRLENFDPAVAQAFKRLRRAHRDPNLRRKNQLASRPSVLGFGLEVFAGGRRALLHPQGPRLARRFSS